MTSSTAYQSGSPVQMRLDSIQVLRGLAALAVVTHHIPLFANGQWGVDLFFVISGFIMCHVTAGSGRDFLAKRIIRVVPLYWAGTLGVFCIALALPRLLDTTTANGTELLKSLLFIPFRKGNHTFPLLFLVWSLNYEMFFYLLFALSMRLSHRYRALICTAAILALVTLGQLWHFAATPVRFFTKPLMLEFVLGMLCYSLLGLGRKGADYRPLRPAARVAWTAAGGILIACLPLATILAPAEDSVIRWGLLAAAAFFCVVHGMSAISLPRGLTIIGDASYSLYLFHPYIIQTFDKVFDAFSGTGLRAYAMALLAIALCCGFALISYRFIERPVSDYLRRRFLDRTPSAAPVDVGLEPVRNR